MFSDFIHAAVYVSTLFLFIVERYSMAWIYVPKFIYPFNNWWTFESFLPFGYYEESCHKHLCTSSCVDIRFQFSWYTPRSGIAKSLIFQALGIIYYLVTWGHCRVISPFTIPSPHVNFLSFILQILMPLFWLDLY